MIAQLSGTVLTVGGATTVIEVGGMGVEVHSTPSTLSQLRVRQSARLYTHLVVREESLTLYGFASEDERNTFVTLQNVQGVGPRMALAMLAVHSPQSLTVAVHAGDRAALEQVPGIGTKVASRLLLELGGKLTLPEDDAGPARAGDARDDVHEALVGLGWNAKAASKAVADVTEGPIAPAEVPTVLRAALQTLGGARG
ncbi:MAG: Holliday junction branch migration protein RuvA [Demequina sp.]